MFSLRMEGIVIIIMWNFQCMLLDLERLYHLRPFLGPLAVTLNISLPGHSAFKLIISLVESKHAVNIAVWKNEAASLLS